MSNQTKKLTSVLLFVFFVSFYFYRLIDLPLIRWDELFWIEKSYFVELALKADFKNELWESVYSYDQPKLAEFMFGAYFYPQYLHYKKEINRPDYAYWQFLIDRNFYESEWESLNPEFRQVYKNNNPNYVYWQTNDIAPLPEYLKEYGEHFRPTLEMIIQARQVNAVVLALSVVIIFWLGSLVGGPILGALGAIAYGFNPLIISAGLHVYSEALFLLLLNAGILALIKFYQKPTNHLMSLMSLGALIGLCFSTKLVGVMLWCFFAFFAAVFWLKQKKRRFPRAVQAVYQVGVVGLVTLIVFVVLNPFTYSNPLVKISKMFAWRQSIVKDQYAGEISPIPDSFISRVINIYKNFYSQSSSAHFNLGAKIVPYGHLFLGGLFLIGFLFLVKTAFAEPEKKKTIALFLSIFFLLQFFAGLYLKLNYDRYFVHFVFFFTFIQLCGLYYVLLFIWRKLHDSRQQHFI